MSFYRDTIGLTQLADWTSENGKVVLAGVAAGVHLLLRLPSSIDDVALAERAMRARIRVAPLSGFYVGRPHARGLVIGYGRVHETAIQPAVKALAAVIRPGSTADELR